MLKIAWIDETYNIIDPMMEPLRRDGWTVLELPSISEARKHISEVLAADVIVSELIVPDGTSNRYPGLNFVRELYEQQCKIPPIVIFSTVSNGLTNNQLKGLGVNEIVHKPVLPSELARIIKRAVKSSPTPAVSG